MDKKYLIDLIFPHKCMLCNEVLARGEVCTVCRSKVQHLLMKDNSRFVNHSCFRKLDRCMAFYIYEDVVKDGVLYAKFKNCAAFIDEFLSYTNFDFGKFFQDNRVDCMISVPYHKSKQYNREYDLPEEMAKVIAKKYNLQYNKDLVIKVKKTKNQHDLSMKERKINLSGAFDVNGDVEGKNIVVIDDIVTTGYSLEEVAKTLKKNGAGTVTAFAFAYNKG